MGMVQEFKEFAIKGNVIDLAVGVIIGAGIYVLLGPATQASGSLVWASFLVAGLLSAITAFSYMELASMFPSAGSEHEFARQVFPRWVSFSTGWAMTLALIVAASTVSLGFAKAGFVTAEVIIRDKRDDFKNVISGVKLATADTATVTE